MRCEEFMTRQVQTIDPEATIQEARSTMGLRRIHHLVVMKGGQVLGVLSDRDVGRGKSGAGTLSQRVADLMTPNPVTADPDTTLQRAANLLRGRSIGCLPIMDGGKLRGIVTVSDLLDLLGRGVERTLPAAKRRKTRNPGERRGPSVPWKQVQPRVRRA